MLVSAALGPMTAEFNDLVPGVEYTVEVVSQSEYQTSDVISLTVHTSVYFTVFFMLKCFYLMLALVSMQGQVKSFFCSHISLR